MPPLHRSQQPAPLADPRAHRRRAADGRARRDDREHRAAVRPGGARASPTSARQWIVTAYALAFGSLLLLGGRLGDLFGRKRVFVIGLAGFAAASALGGVAPSFGVLVGARALQGAFAALLAPGGAVPADDDVHRSREERNRAFGVFGAIAGSGAAVGLILGGVLTEYLDWRWYDVRQPHPRRPGRRRRAAPAAPTTPCGRAGSRIDLPGHADRLGRPVRARLRLLQRRDRRLGRPGHDRRRSPPASPCWPPSSPSSAASSTRCCRCASSPTATAAAPSSPWPSVGAGMFGVFLFLTYYMQQTLGFSPLNTGLAFLPMMAVIMPAGAIGQTRLLPALRPPAARDRSACCSAPPRCSCSPASPSTRATSPTSSPACS